MKKGEGKKQTRADEEERNECKTKTGNKIGWEGKEGVERI